MENQILGCLPSADLRKLSKYMEHIELPVRTQLERSNKKITQVYFLESGFASVVAGGTSGSSIEVGMIGNEGVTGLAVAMGSERSTTEAFMQTAGTAYRISAADLDLCMDENEGLRKCLLRYAHVFFVQMAQTCLANAHNKLEARLARWLLMAQDRMGSNELELTHEFLATMLGVRRPGVTLALKLIEKRGLIRRSRGRIIVIDREGLEKKANGSYGVAEAELARLFG